MPFMKTLTQVLKHKQVLAQSDPTNVLISTIRANVTTNVTIKAIN